MPEPTSPPSGKDRWIELYRIEQDRYHNSIGYLNAHLRFFSSITVAIVGGAIFLAKEFRSDHGLELALMIGGVLISGFSMLAGALIESGYKHWMQTTTTLAKYENLLELHNHPYGGMLWKGESIILPGFISDMESADFSEVFVQRRMNAGTMWSMRVAVHVATILGVFAFLLGIALLVRDGVQPETVPCAPFNMCLTRGAF